MILHIMILESIAALIEHAVLVGNNHNELVALFTIIHDTVIIICFQQRKYVCDAPVVKPYGSETGESCLRPGDPCPCIAVDTDKQSTCIADLIN